MAKIIERGTEPHLRDASWRIGRIATCTWCGTRWMVEKEDEWQSSMPASFVRLTCPECGIDNALDHERASTVMSSLIWCGVVASLILLITVVLASR